MSAPGLNTFFFFSSRRRQTRCSRDWSSDVCSSDLAGTSATVPGVESLSAGAWAFYCKRSEERRVGKSVDLGGRRIIKKKKIQVIFKELLSIFTSQTETYSGIGEQES